MELGRARQARVPIEPRRMAAIAAGKLAGALSRVLNRGGGTALPGLVATAIDTSLVSDLAAQLAGIALVTGTNGKTTTSRMLASILDQAHCRLLRNQSGSNLVRGVATSLVECAGLLGAIPRSHDLFGVFEIDEAALPDVLQAIEPRTLTLLDLFRDQLDRYGEVATVARLWSGAIARLQPDTAVIVNADDPLLADLATRVPGGTVYFGVETANTMRVEEHASDVKSCPRCGGPITYDTVYFGHLGHYRCSSCGFARPKPVVVAFDVQLLGIRGSSFRLSTPGGDALVSLKLPGLYNVYNALGAAATAWSLEVDVATIAAGLDASTPPFGRMERLLIQERDVFIALAKNPAGLNEVLRTATEDPAPINLLMMLNDNIADGRDVSWIWDADIEMLEGHVDHVTFAGTRAADMALRFKYAEALPNPGSPDICMDTSHAFARALDAVPPGAPLFIIPTYTALLDIRAALTHLGYARPYWEE
jgi:UDP-N-acetylmuramyl tripeptide synthase